MIPLFCLHAYTGLITAYRGIRCILPNAVSFQTLQQQLIWPTFKRSVTHMLLSNALLSNAVTHGNVDGLAVSYPLVKKFTDETPGYVDCFVKHVDAWTNCVKLCYLEKRLDF